MKCITCGKKAEAKSEDGREYYTCSEGHENSRMILNEGLEHYRESGEVVHISVGALIFKEGKVLLLNRRKYPFKHTIPAGHLDKNEDPDKAVIREVREETGLEITDPELITEEKLEDPCRRGADYHYWYLYSKTLEKDVSIELNDEADGHSWIELSDLQEIELTEPTEYFLLKKGFNDL